MASCTSMLLSRSSSSFFTKLSNHKFPKLPFRRTFCSAATTTTSNETLKHSLLLDRLRSRHLKDAPKPTRIKIKPNTSNVPTISSIVEESDIKSKQVNGGFEELGLSEEVMNAIKEMGIEEPTEIQRIGVPSVLDGKSVVLGSHTGSGKTLAYLLPLVQLLRRDEELYGMMMKPRRPKAVVLCPTRELCEQVFRVSKAISHHARFRSTRISGGGRLRPQEDSLNVPIDMVVGTPGRLLQHIQDGNLVYGDIKYLVLDEADTMFDRGFGPDIRKFLEPLKKRAEKPGDQGFQTIMVTATMTKAVQKLVDDEFEGIVHLRTSSLHKRIATAHHDFIKLSGTENKLDSLLQVLEPSLSKGNRVMVFCNTLNSSRAVDHFLGENQIYTVNYHGEVPAVERVENLKKFKSDEGDCPTLVCTDLAARGLDLDVDHVIMFDFPLNSVDYLHRTGRTARMGAKGKVTSLVTKKDYLLASRIEEAIKKNESLESLNSTNVKRDVVKSKPFEKTGRGSKLMKVRNTKDTSTRRITKASAADTTRNKFVRGRASKKTVTFSKRKSVTSYADSGNKDSSKPKSVKSYASSANRSSSMAKSVKSYGNSVKRVASKGKSSGMKSNTASKLSVVGFRGKTSSSKRDSM